MDRNGAITQSLPSLRGTRNSFWHRAHHGSQKQASSRFDSSAHLSAQLASSSSTPALPRIRDALMKQESGPKGALWRESAAVLQANAGKLPFLNHQPHPHSDRSLVDTQELLRLQRDAKVTRESNASALRLAYETRGTMPRGLGGTMRGFGTLRPGEGRPGDVTQKAGPELAGAAGSFGSGAGGKRQKRVAKLRESMRVMNRKDNMQAALGKDREFVQQFLARTVETPHTRQTREQQFDDHWWEAVFSPIPEPLRYLPVAFKSVSPLAAMRLTGQRFRINTPATPAAADARKHATAALVLTYEEVQEVIRVCTLFQALTEKPDSSPPVLSRPSFCRMAHVMSGLSASPKAPVRLCRAMLHFDRLAEKVHVRGCSYPGGTVVGLSLQSPGNMSSGFQQELTVTKLFTTLLKEMMPHGSGDVETSWQVAKMRLFDELFPQAEQYATERAAFVRQIQAGGPPKPQITQATPIQEEIEVVIKDDDNPRSSRRNSKSVVQSRGGSVNPSPRGRRSASSVSPANVASAAEEVEKNGSESEADKDEAHGALLYAHTFAVLKGELLMCQMLEPEVLHVLLEYQGLFYELFRAYADIPMSSPEEDGHMTLAAFLRFCDDFGLFPTKVDFQTAQWLYNSAIICTEDKIDSSSSTAGDAIAADTDAEKMVLKAKAGRGRKKPRGRERADSAISAQLVAPPPPHMVLWSGKWLKGHLAWLTKDHGEMSDAELRCARLLEPLNEWMSYRQLMSRDVFSSKLPQGCTDIGLEAFLAVVEFMHLEDPPSKEELAELMTLISPNGKEEIDYHSFDTALMIMQKKKENLDRATNSFLKDYKDMSQAEYSACLFFKELQFLLEKNRWTPEELFRKMDTDGNGALDNDEVMKQLNAFLKANTPLALATVTAAGTTSPFNVLDLNSDNKVTLQEFVSIFQQVDMAKEFQSKMKSEAQHPLFVSSNTPSADNTTPHHQRAFGHKAFVECLVKVALVHLSYHASAMQAEQSSLFKVLWLLMYLSWQFDRALAKKEEVDAKKVEVEHRISPKAAEQTVKTMLMLPGPKHVPPLQRLLQERPRLFVDMQIKPIISAIRMTNGFEKSAWGCVADNLLKECLDGSDKPQAHGPQSFDRLLFDMVIS